MMIASTLLLDQVLDLRDLPGDVAAGVEHDGLDVRVLGGGRLEGLLVGRLVAVHADVVLGDADRDGLVLRRGDAGGCDECGRARPDAFASLSCWFPPSAFLMPPPPHPGGEFCLRAQLADVPECRSARRSPFQSLSNMNNNYVHYGHICRCCRPSKTGQHQERARCADAEELRNRTDRGQSTGQSAPRTHMRRIRVRSRRRCRRGRGRRCCGLIDFLEDFSVELETALRALRAEPVPEDGHAPDPQPLEGRTVTPSSLAAASGVPYATAMRRMDEMKRAGLIEQRPRTRTGKSFSLHPSAELIEAGRSSPAACCGLAASDLRRPARTTARDYYFGRSYMAGQLDPAAAGPARAAERSPGGLRILVHGDPTFMVMENLKRQFEQIVGCRISQRAFSIDRLREEALRNAERRTVDYDIVAVDLPWIGEFAEARRAAAARRGDGHRPARSRRLPHRRLARPRTGAGGPMACPSQTTPELLFYRTRPVRRGRARAADDHRRRADGRAGAP